MKPTSGFWRMTTETAVYMFDLDHMVVARMPGEDAIVIENDEPVYVTAAKLRRDNEPMRLLKLPTIELNKPCWLHLDLAGDGEIVTIRQTTPVQSIEQLARGRGEDDGEETTRG